MITLMDYSNDEHSASLLKRSDGLQGPFKFHTRITGRVSWWPAGCSSFHETKISQLIDAAYRRNCSENNAEVQTPKQLAEIEKPGEKCIQNREEH
jgi:hypothetical protein